MTETRAIGDFSREEKRRLLARMLGREKRRRSFPLSFGQQRFWFLDQLQPGNPAYNLLAAWRLSGPLRPEAFAAALREITRRHRTLRTTFESTDEEPAQVVGPVRGADLPVVDLVELPEHRRRREARRLVDRCGATPFDLSRGPLYRVLLLRLAATEAVVLIAMHHIVSDGWSLDIFFRELAVLYGCAREGRASPLPEITLHYVDFARWQRDWLRGERLERELAYWRGQLADAAVLELPGDRPRPAVPTSRGAVVGFSLPRALLEGLHELSRRQGVTLHMTLLAAYKVWLHRWSAQRDVSVGSPVAGRPRAQLEQLIGFFVNTLVLRSKPRPHLAFTDYLESIRRISVEALEHQYVPFERLVEELRPDRDMSHPPLFQVAFALQNTPDSVTDLPGLKLEPWSIATSAAKFDLTMELEEKATGLAGTVELNLDVFDRSTVRRGVAHFGRLLRSLLEDPRSPLAELALMTAPERAQALAEWNDTVKPCPQRPMVHELFAEHARRRPEALAAVSHEGVLSYGELDTRSNRLGNSLETLGVGPEVRVALCTEKTLARCVGILGVVKAGGVYVSLDPTYPKERLAFLLADAGARVLLTQEALLDLLPDSSARLLCLDRDWDTVSLSPSEIPVSGVGPQNLAYVVYTSGSTGRPKGVEIPHSGLMNLVRWHQDLYSVTASDHGTQVASPAFDASIWEFWPYLTAGACSHIPDEETRLSSAGMVRWWGDEGITLAYLPTPLAEGALREEIPPDLPLRVRALIIGGDRLHGRPRPESGIRLMNHYGPAEYSIVTTVVEVPPSAEGGLPSVGRAIDNTDVYLLDATGHPVPIGVPGELYVGGTGLARGYLDRRGMSAEKFVPHPWSAVAGERLYRTGDQIRWLPDGDLDFIGRFDHQVKLRGLRIELGEIEAALDQYPGLREAAVLVREDRPGDKRLTGYLVVQEAPLALDELRAFLRQRLPEYMIPAAFVELEALPLTPNGKVDRRALPAPDRSSDEAFVAPRNPAEEVLAGIWSDVLGVARVGAEDDFFDLGGHSLMATRVVSRIEEAFGVKLPLVTFFESPRIAALAEAVADAGPYGGPGREIPLVPVGRQGALPLSFAQERLWFLHQLEPSSPAYNVPSAFHLKGRLRPALLGVGFGEAVRRHETLRTSFGTVDGEPIQRIVPAAARWRLPTVDLAALPSVRQAQEARGRLAAEAARPFDLARGPLVRAFLVRLGRREYVLFLNLHHIIADGWSMGVLVEEVNVLYRALSHGEPSPLTDLPVQYADFAVWQRSWLSGGELERQLRYWRDQLAGAPAELALPTDRPRPAALTLRGAYRRRRLPSGLQESTRALGRRRSTTPFMTLLAAWAALLERFTGQTDVVIGSPIANRTRPEVERLIGFFVNTLALRVDLSPSGAGRRPSFRELLDRVRSTTLEGYAHQDVPFERLVDELVADRSLDRSPLFQVMLVLQNAPLETVELPDLELRPMALETHSSKFDLTLGLEEADEGLETYLEYSTDLFDRTTADRLLARFEHLLRAVTAAPEMPLHEVDYLSDAERQAVVVEWNDVATAYPASASIPELFTERAVRAPEATAVVFGDEALSYGELAARSDRLAGRLRALGVGPEARVGLSAERSAELPVALLGILKAGGAYVPLDPEYPPERLAFMVADAGLELLVTAGVGTLGRPRFSGSVVEVSEALSAGAPAAGPADSPDASQLAYVLYTSGSTGTPKGVAVSHRSVVRLVRDTSFAELGPEEVFLLLAPVSFDASTLEIWGPLLNGGRLVVAPPGAPSLEELGDLLGRHGITTLWLTAGLFHLMLEERSEDLVHVRQLLAGGDALSVSHLRRFLAAGGGPVINGYGPTENTTFTLCHRVSGEHDLGSTVPIGRPIRNTRAYVLDRRLRPVPPGVWGELLAAGAGLGRSYAGQPGLTADRFAPDPVSGEPGERLYRTGDRVRFLGDGRVEFGGRLDRQVKIRGFRIEPGEVEALLASHPEVSEAAVVVRGKGADKRLVAYVAGAAATAAGLRSWLGDRLPDYMVPSAVVELESLPLSPTGKIDRRALPEPEEPGSTEVRPATAPRTPAEELVADVFATTLGLGSVGREDDFFELGGHSLLATRTVSHLERLFNVALPLRRLFEDPTVAELARYLETAKTQRTRPPLVPVPREQPLPLSFAQERLWLVDRIAHGSPAYNIPLAMVAEGKLDTRALEAAFQQVLRRHEALRTRFDAGGAGPVQVVEPFTPRPLPVVDVSALGRNAAARQVDAAVRREARRLFDLGTGPLVTAVLWRLGTLEHVFFVNMHHIVSDGWSMGILVDELAASYGAVLRGEPAGLEELAVQYPDFAVWQRSWMKGDELERLLGYWRRQLSGAPRVLALPADRPRPPVRSFLGRRRVRRVPAALLGRVRSLCREEGVTLFMSLLASGAVLLRRLTGQDDVLVGTPIANRNTAEIEGLIGFFVNTLTLRVGLAGEGSSFRELLGRVRQVTLDAYAHQDLPFERLVEELAVERSLDRSPLFQVMIVLQNAPVGDLELPGLDLRPRPAETETAKFDLTLVMEEDAGTLTIAAEYATDLFEATTVERWLRQLERGIGAQAATPEAPLASLSWMSDAERHALTSEWKGEKPERAPGETIPGLFAAAAASVPEAAAVVFGQEILTYQELRRRAADLARHLVRAGVGPESRVGLWMDRSPELVTGILGILEAGGAYVPLDPSHPARRLAFMVEDSRVRTLVTARGGRAAPSFFSGTVVESGRAPDGSAPVARPRSSGPRSANLAYVVYTSGSTGRPKGVEVCHRSVARLVRNPSFAELGSSEVFLQLAPVAFDASTLELWGPLLNGGRLVVAPPEPPAPAELGALIRRHRVSTLWLTSGLFHLMVDERPEDLAGLRQLLAGGDVLSAAHVRRLLASSWPGRLVNGYGPTENTTFTACCPLVSPRELPAKVPIGRAVSGTEVYVVDRRLDPVPAGVVGELLAGGDGLARGYAARPSLSARCFVPDPVSGRIGERLYRTGDLVRYLADGRLEFLGRRDFQVKIRGFRIEPAEVEALLAQHPEVRGAVVLVREDLPGEKRLVSYVTGTAGEQELRGYLGDKLPDYMQPAAWVFPESLPLTPNGKVDRRALPAPERNRPRSRVAPSTALEADVAAAFADVLGVEEVGAEDDFFDLGGHSLSAARVISRLNRRLGLEIPLRDLFEAPSPAALAGRVEERRPDAAEEVADLVPVPRNRPLALSFAQERLWVLDRLEPHGAAYNVPIALELEGELGTDVLERGLLELVNRHEALRTTFRESEGGPVQVIGEVPDRILAHVDLSALSAEKRETELDRRVELESTRPFDLGEGPLVRATLLRCRRRRHVLVLVLHHVISDGWSMGILVRELTRLYEAFSRDEASPLEPLPVQYADFAAWQRQWLSGRRLETRISYWRHRLAGAPPALELPVDRPRAPVESFHGGRRRFALTGDELPERGRRQGATLFMTLLAVWSALLARLTGQDDLVVGSPIGNRDRPEIEGLVGFFVNTLVLRVPVSGDPSFRGLLDRARDTALGAYAHQELPFERLVDELGVPRSLDRPPVFQSMLALENTPRTALGTGSLRLAPRDFAPPYAKFELSLSATRDGAALALELEYKTDLFDATTIARWHLCLERLIREVLDEPDRPLSQVDLLSAPERHTLTTEWNVQSSGPAGAETLHGPVTQQARRAPEAISVTGGEAWWSYSELDRAADRVAGRLRALGIGRGDRVAVCLERTPALVASILGVLRAGAVYVPLDPAYPRPRLDFMVEDSGTSLTLTTPESGPAPADRAFDPPAVGPGDPAYVIYTSGSTGIPKGVVLRHGNAAALVAWALAAYSPEELSVVLAATSVCFDLSVFELFVPLAAGGRIVLVHNALALPEVPAASRLTLVNTVPSALRELIRLAAVPGSVRTINLAGEPLLAALAGAIHERTGAQRLFNLYGPSEDTTYSTGARVDPSEAVPPIGRPLAGSGAFLADPRMRLVGRGIVGELYLAGAGLALGYHGRPALTARRFVPHPWRARKGRRLYRTGDLARHRADGHLEFLGRGDFQVKVRGFRVELGEIESALSAHSSVRETVVTVTAGDDPEIVAYVTGDGPDPEELRRHLRSRLPEHLVPALWIVLDALPLLPNGKVDRRALPEPSRRRRRRAQTPRTPSEELVAGSFALVLEVEEIGRDDDFFEFGGHSLLATRLVSHLQQACGLAVPLRKVFEHSTVAALARYVETADPTETPPPIVKVPRDGRLPLSFAQERLWFLDRLLPGSAAYNVPMGLELEGELDTRALEGAYHALAARHEALRTTFAEVEGELVQVIGPPPRDNFLQVDLETLPTAAAELRRRLGVDARQGFDLETGPLARAVLYRTGARRHLLLVNLHHIVFDGWSMDILVAELIELYRAFSRGEAPQLAPLPIQYADFAAWQRNRLDERELGRQLEFWRRELADAPTELALPADRPRPTLAGMRGIHWPVAFPGPFRAALDLHGRREGATLFMVILAGWAALLGRLAGQSEVVVGAPIANRIRPESEGLIGFFVNTLPLRIGLVGRPSWRGLLARVRHTALGAYAHQDLPFERMVEELGVERALNHQPLFQAILAFQRKRGETAEMPEGLRLSSFDPETWTTKFDLSLILEDDGAGLAGVFEYSTDLFDPTTVERWFSQLGRLLEAAHSDPECPLAQLPLLAPAERHAILVEANDVASSYPRGETVPGLFAAQVSTRPEAVAVAFAEEALTYGELASRSGRLARLLRESGVSRGARVGVHLERSLELVVALLGVLRAGGAYVPLDPDYPDERLRFMVSDAGVHVLITSGGHDFAGRDVVALSAESTGPEGSDEDLAPEVNPEGLAYVIYTSGSTGRPKGVAVPHRAVVRLVRETNYAELGPEEVFLQLAPAAFDASTFEIWGALANGGRLVVAPSGRLSLAELGELLATGRVTTLWLTAGLFHAFVEERVEDLAGVRRLLAGGDVLLVASVERLFASSWHGVLINGYGPTENTTFTSCCRMRSASEVGRSVSIGRPVSNTRIYEVDRELGPVPLGAGGELATSGDGLAWGYVDRPGPTAERFVPDPSETEPGGRLYLTGDRVRLRPDGRLEFLGRIDQQLKIRGFRIEPGEIEAAIAAHPGVRETVVVAWPGEDTAAGGSEKRLVGYAVAEGVTRADLEAHLEARLPVHMLPAAILLLDALPLTPNGKVDRRALPRPDWAGAEREGFVAPRDETELALVRLWEEVLGVAGVGVTESFFDRGGHSLLAVRLMARIAERWGELPLSVIFENATVEKLARLLRRRADGTGPGRRVLVEIRRGAGRRPFFCVHPVGGNVFCYLELVRELDPELPFYGLQAPPPGLVAGTRLEDLAAHYVDAIAAVQPSGPYRLGGWSMGGVVAYEMARQLHEAGEEIELVAMLDSPPPANGEARAAHLDPAALLAGFARDLTGGRIPWSAEELHRLDRGAQFERILELARSAGVVPQEAKPRLLEELFETFRHNLRALREYDPAPYPGRVEWFRAEATAAAEPDGWGELAGDLGVHPVPGDHYTFLETPHVRTLAARLRPFLELGG